MCVCGRGEVLLLPPLQSCQSSLLITVFFFLSPGRMLTAPFVTRPLSERNGGKSGGKKSRAHMCTWVSHTKVQQAGKGNIYGERTFYAKSHVFVLPFLRAPNDSPRERDGGGEEEKERELTDKTSPLPPPSPPSPPNYHPPLGEGGGKAVTRLLLLFVPHSAFHRR